MTCPSNKQDSNNTGLRFAVESCLKVLPTVGVDGFDPTWYPLEPNSYGDFGAKIKTVARNPINPTRQRQKGVVTDLDANASFTMDLTQTNHARLLQGFMFAMAREKPTSAPLNSAVIPTTAVATADDSYAVANGTASLFLAGTLVMASGFSNATNNGLKVCDAPATGKVVVLSNLVDEASPPATASLQAVGFEFESGESAIAISGGLPQLTASTTDLTTLGLMAGEWIYVGGDATANTLSVNKGFARIKTIAAGAITFDKVDWASPAVEAGTGKTLRIFYGTVIRNEDDPQNIVRQSFQFERTLGEDDDGTMSEVVVGAVANEMSIEMKQADKATVDLGFIGCDAVSYSGLDGQLDGARPALVASGAFNTSSDMKRIALSILDPATSVPTPLFAYCTDVSLKIGNGVSGAKAVGVLGNFDTSAGTFDVSGSLTAYFQDVRATQAVRNNSDITMDLILVKNNAGLVFDIPLLTLGNGLPKVEQDKPVTLPLDTMAAESEFGHTLLYVNFPYLPNAAAV